MRGVLLALTIFSITANCDAQKVTSFYEKLHQFSYPENPLPVSCQVYGVSAEVSNKSIVTIDYRGDRLNLHDLKVLWGGFNPNNGALIPKLHTFKKYGKSKLPFENGFLLSIDMDDVEVYHKYTGADNTYELIAAYEYKLSVKHKDQIVVSDTVKYADVLDTFVSELPEEDIHIIATNKARNLAVNLNEIILKNSVSTFQRFAKNNIDLVFEKDYIKFYGITKHKKLSSGEKLKLLDERLHNIKKLDQDRTNRDAFTNELDDLITSFEELKQSNDYNNNRSFVLYVSSNLASLYALTEYFGLAEKHYKQAEQQVERERFRGILKDEMLKMTRRKKNKSKMFDTDGNFKQELSIEYLNYYTTKIKTIN